MADRSGYIGRAPGDSTVIVARQTFTPSGVTTNFTFSSGYDPGYMDCYLNGIRLINASDYTAQNGSTVGLTSFAQSGDVVELVAYKAFNLGTINSANGNFTVGEKLTVSGISSLTDVVSSGIVTADSFSGNLGPGAVTITDSTAATSSDSGALIVNGGVGIAKSLFVREGLSVGGTITYDDVTNIDSIGIVTAGKGFRATTGGIIVTAGVSTLSGGVNLNTGNLKVTAGIVTVGAGLTLSDDLIHLSDNVKINCGVASDLVIYHAGGGDSTIHHTATSGSALRFRSRSYTFKNQANSATIATMNEGAEVNLYWNNSKKVETTSPGILVSGMCSATEFNGDGSGLSGVGGDTDITSCLFI